MTTSTARRSSPLALVAALALGSCGFGGTSPEVFPRLEIVTTSLPDAVIGEPYSEAIHAEGGGGGYSWTRTAGALPSGLTLAVDDLGDGDALITGAPEGSPATYTFTVTVSSEDGQTASREFTIEVLPEVVPLRIETPAVPPALAGATYSVQLRAVGGLSAREWELVDGSLPTGLVLTVTGRIEGTPAVPDTARFTVEVRSDGETQRRAYVLPVVPHDLGGYNITTFLVTDVPDFIRTQLEAAVAEWQTAITSDHSAGTIPQGFFGPNGCGGFGRFVEGTSVDDVLVIVNIRSIDGVGGVLAQAGPCAIRSATNGEIPVVGIVTLDSDDLLAATETPDWVRYIISHELAHVFGFGSLWKHMDLLSGADTNDPRFTGTRATEEYNALGGTGAVPVEATGGEGTALSHWRQTVFRDERMTGFSAAPTAHQPLSRVSIASIADLGYGVDLSAADSYTLQSALHGPVQADGRHHWGDHGWDEILLEPVRVLDPVHIIPRTPRSRP